MGFRDGGRSYIVDLSALSQTDFASGDVRPIRSCKPDTAASSGVLQAASASKEAAPAVVTATVEKASGAELGVGETVDVPGSGSKPYTVKNCGGGVWSCTCIAWKMQGKKPTNERSCKHIVSIRGAEAED